MRNRLAPTKNVAALQLAFEALASRDVGVPGMGLVYGYTGAGKTTAVTWLVNRTRGVYVRANSGWTPAAMLAKVMQELGAEPFHRRAAMVDFIATTLTDQQRPLFVDECDYLLRNVAMLDSLRDLHDLSGTPVVLVGMQGIERRLVHRPQLSRRISHWVEFHPSDMDDAKTLAQTVCEVELDADLIARIHRESKGSIGLMSVGLSRVEAFAKANGLKAMTETIWGARKLFLGAPANSF
jgi:DNA transposition AAA+ family ATPase